MYALPTETKQYLSELQLQTIVSHQMSAGYPTRVLWKNSWNYQPLTHRSGPNFLSFLKFCFESSSLGLPNAGILYIDHHDTAHTRLFSKAVR